MNRPRKMPSDAPAYARFPLLVASLHYLDGGRPQLCRLTGDTTAWEHKRQILTTKAESFLKSGGEGRT